MPSLFDQLKSAAQGFVAGWQSRSIAPIDTSMGRSYGMPHSWKPQQSLEAYGDNVWLYRSVFTIAVQIASIDFKLRIVGDNGEITKVTNHQSLETLRLPQPTKGGKSMLSAFDLKFVTALHLLLNGEAFWHLDRRLKMGGSPTFIRPLLAQNMRVVLSEDGEVLEYVYSVGGKEQRFDPMDIVHFKFPDPKNWYRGHSPVKPIRYSMDTHRKADEMNTSKLDNFASPSGVLETPNAVAQVERQRVAAEWTSLYGGTKNAGKTAVLPSGIKFTKTQESNREMEFTEGKKLSRDEIAANYGVGMEIFGKTESQTRANAEASIFIFREFGVNPFAIKYNDTLDNDYMPAFPNPKGATWYYDSIVPENMEDKRATAQMLFDRAAMTPDQLLKEFGREPLNIPGVTDVPYAAGGLMPAEFNPPEPDPALVPDTNA